MANNNMYDLHHTTTPFCSSPSEPTDDISIFLRQILLKSSSSSSSCSQFVTPKQMQCQIQQQQPHPDSLSFADAANIPVNVVGHVSSSSVGTIDYDQDEYDCESEEGLENLMEEMIVKPNPGRNTTKRTRAAEVHNMSEKRRRSRINEKMKALQKLIPNSNKSDKASMLDEAIEYLKQLQLQVQALTMRNGINWYSMSAPHGVPQPNQNHRPSGIYQGIQSMNMTANQERLVTVNPMLSQNQPSILDFSSTINQGPSFGTQLGSS